jgi:hypothetical protein
VEVSNSAQLVTDNPDVRIEVEPLGGIAIIWPALELTLRCRKEYVVIEPP